MKRFLFSTGAALLALGLTGCSTFESRWRGEVARGPSAAAGISGPWEGHWVSEASGHSGRLRALVAAEGKPAPGGGDLREFDYHATWKRVLSKTFHTVQPVRRTGPQAWESEGAWTLPDWAGGTYRYEIRATPDQFRATYRSGGDHGRFEMRRPWQQDPGTR